MFWSADRKAADLLRFLAVDTGLRALQISRHEASTIKWARGTVTLQLIFQISKLNESFLTETYTNTVTWYLSLSQSERGYLVLRILRLSRRRRLGRTREYAERMNASGPDPSWLRRHESFNGADAALGFEVLNEVLDLTGEAQATAELSATINAKSAFGRPTVFSEVRVMPSMCVFLEIGNKLPFLKNSPG